MVGQRGCKKRKKRKKENQDKKQKSATNGCEAAESKANPLLLLAWLVFLAVVGSEVR